MNEGVYPNALGMPMGPGYLTTPNSHPFGPATRLKLSRGYNRW